MKINKLPEPQNLEELIGQLDALLKIYSRAENGVSDITTLAGYFVGLVSAPNPIRAQRWFVTLFAGKENLPNWDKTTAAAFVDRLMLFYDFIEADMQYSLDANESHPLFIERLVNEKIIVVADDWCRGYHLARYFWRLTYKQVFFLQALLAPIDCFVAQGANTRLTQLTPRQRAALQLKIPPAALKAYQFLRCQ